ncbi:serine/threonine-protein kinase [Streptomyces sp. MJP52]|uniref:serine/threonine-protein kinase n=1 Tax=Streptomyces sp. MJP52 TaxID=2940555 RepID=UPI0024744922|nr:serine/threonine-protein kinase [Streptomyces sp. MJP52]MDH6227842.1 serine/threonine protein kinase [Streptomyces sp. MJP52]
MGDRLIDGRFRLGRVLGRGSMGEVHEADDLDAPQSGPARRVAVKMILRHRTGAAIDASSDPKATRRFEREVRIMRRLDHPNLTRLVAGGVTGSGLHYLAMELLDGETLHDLIGEEPRLPLPWVTAVGTQIADGLAAAHMAGIVHRDLKPSNVMLTAGGTVKVLDFGMGRIVDDPDETSLTSRGQGVGTARYMAPEQFTGGQVTPAADLYALGCVLHEMLVGTPPFVGDSPFDLALKHTRETPEPVRLLREETPPELARLVDGLLTKDPAERPDDAAPVRDALRALTVATAGDPRGGLPHWSRVDPVRPVTAAAGR